MIDRSIYHAFILPIDALSKTLANIHLPIQI